MGTAHRAWERAMRRDAHWRCYCAWFRRKAYAESIRNNVEEGTETATAGGLVVEGSAAGGKNARARYVNAGNNGAIVAGTGDAGRPQNGRAGDVVARGVVKETATGAAAAVQARSRT